MEIYVRPAQVVYRRPSASELPVYRRDPVVVYRRG